MLVRGDFQPYYPPSHGSIPEAFSEEHASNA